MGESELSDDVVNESGPLGEGDRGRGLFVIDFTVGPPGVGPATSVEPDADGHVPAELPLEE